jgi:hypothetical protein
VSRACAENGRTDRLRRFGRRCEARCDCVLREVRIHSVRAHRGPIGCPSEPNANVVADPVDPGSKVHPLTSLVSRSSRVRTAASMTQTEGVRAKDTSQAAHDLQVRLYRAMSPAGRSELALRMSDDVRQVAAEGIRKRHPTTPSVTFDVLWSRSFTARIPPRRSGRTNRYRPRERRRGFPVISAPWESSTRAVR